MKFYYTLLIIASLITLSVSQKDISLLVNGDKQLRQAGQNLLVIEEDYSNQQMYLQVFTDFATDTFVQKPKVQLPISDIIEYIMIDDVYTIYVSTSTVSNGVITLTIKEYDNQIDEQNSKTFTLNCSSAMCSLNTVQFSLVGNDAYVTAFADSGAFFFAYSSTTPQDQISLLGICAEDISSSREYFNQFDNQFYILDRTNNYLCVINAQDLTVTYQGSIIHDVTLIAPTNNLDNYQFQIVGPEQYALFEEDKKIMYYIKIYDSNSLTNPKTVELTKYQGTNISIQASAEYEFVMIYDENAQKVILESLNTCKSFEYQLTSERRNVRNYENYVIIELHQDNQVFAIGQSDITSQQVDSCCNGTTHYYGKTDSCEEEEEEKETTDNSNIIIANIALLSLLISVLL